MSKTFLIKVFLLILFITVKSFGQNPVKEKIKSDIKDISITISYDSNDSHTDYTAERNSGISDTDKYVIERDADRGLIKIPCSGKILKAYMIGRDSITKIIKTKYEMDVYDRTDYIFTLAMVFIVHTSTGNAGIFTESEVYSLPRFNKKEEYISYLNLQDEKCSGSKEMFLEMLDFCIRHNIPI